MAILLLVAGFSCLLLSYVGSFAASHLVELTGSVAQSVLHSVQGDVNNGVSVEANTDLALLLPATGEVLCYITVKPGQAASAPPLCAIEGHPLRVKDVGRLPLTSGDSLFCLRLALDPPTGRGDARVSLTVSFSGGGTRRLPLRSFAPYFAARSFYDYPFRVVRLATQGDWLCATVYNEADQRKAGLVIEKVLLDGNDVTAASMLPQTPIPADTHRYVEDERDVWIPLPKPSRSEHNLAIQYRVLDGAARPSPLEAGTVGIHSVRVVRDLPLAVGGEDGPYLPGCACLFNGALRPLNRFTAHERPPEARAVPVYACMPEGCGAEELRHAGEVADFLVVSPPRDTRMAGVDVVTEFGSYHSLVRRCSQVPFITSVAHDVACRFSEMDAKWLSLAALAEGSKGVVMETSPELGNEQEQRRYALAAEALLRDIGQLKDVLAVAVRCELDIECEDKAIYARALMCGPGDVVIIAVNRWTTRLSKQGGEPFHASRRGPMSIRVKLAPTWVVGSVRDLGTAKNLAFSERAGDVIRIAVPPVSIGRVLLIHRAGYRAALAEARPLQALAEDEGLSADILPEECPFVKLGNVFPGEERVVPFRAHNTSPRTVVVRPDDSPAATYGSWGKRGEALRLEPHASGLVKLAVTVPRLSGPSATVVRIADSESPSNHFDVYFDVNVRPHVGLEPGQVDFGRGDDTRNRWRRVSVLGDGARVVGFDGTGCPFVAEIEDHGRAFRFRPTPRRPGEFAGVIEVRVERTGVPQEGPVKLRFFGHSGTSIYSSPERVVLLKRELPARRTIRLIHGEARRFQILDVRSNRTWLRGEPNPGGAGEQRGFVAEVGADAADREGYLTILCREEGKYEETTILQVQVRLIDALGQPGKVE
jgi:hypothetical protein